MRGTKEDVETGDVNLETGSIVLDDGVQAMSTTQGKRGGDESKEDEASFQSSQSRD
jgi:hypothetical protein